MNSREEQKSTEVLALVFGKEQTELDCENVPAKSLANREIKLLDGMVEMVLCSGVRMAPYQ